MPSDGSIKPIWKTKEKMKDKGLVIFTNKDLAEVEVECIMNTCRDCSAKALCIGRNQDKGHISAKNPVDACPGDEVLFEVPEDKYSRALIYLFSILLVSSLLGLGLGTMLSSFTQISSTTAGASGLFLGLIAGGIGTLLLFRKQNRKYLYPVIIDIIKKGDCHG
jgi:positive regulator of sigma E activity